jgi:hypothetical protein
MVINPHISIAMSWGLGTLGLTTMAVGFTISQLLDQTDGGLDGFNGY